MTTTVVSPDRGMPPGVKREWATPERAIMLEVFARTWKGALALGISFGIVAIGSASSYISSFPTEQSRTALVQSFGANTGFSMLFGSVAHLGTIGGYTSYKSYVFLTTIGVVWAIMVTTRQLRGEEESGRWFLLLAGPTDAVRVTVTTLLGMTLATAVIFVCTALIMAGAGQSASVQLDVGGSLAFAAATVMPIVAFVGIAAVASQLARTRHLASTIGLGVFAVSFVLRMFGDSGNGRAWLRWLTPLGWAELVWPFTHNNWFPLVLGFGLAIATGGVAAIAAGRRDAGSGVLATNEIRPPRLRWLGSPTALAARLAAPVTVAWAAGIIGTSLAFGSVTHSVVSVLEASNSMSATLTKLGGSGAGAAAFLSAAFLLLGAVLALVPAHQISMARDEERSGRLALVLAASYDRRRWLIGRIALVAATVAVLGPLAGVATWFGAVALGAHIGFWTVVSSGVSMVPVAWVALAIGIAVLAVAPRSAPASVELLVGWSLIINLLGSLVSGLGGLRRLSLFYYAGTGPTGGVVWSTWIIMSIVAVVTLGLAVAHFDRRDLAEG